MRSPLTAPARPARRVASPSPLHLLVLVATTLLLLLSLARPAAAARGSPCRNICRRWFRPARRDCRAAALFNACRVYRCPFVRVRRVRRRDGRLVRRRVVRKGWICSDRPQPRPNPAPVPAPPPPATAPPATVVLPPLGPATVRLQEVDLVVTFLWEAGRQDLDTAVRYGGETTGWECVNEFDATFTTFGGDDNTRDGTEQHFVDIGKARNAGLWSTTTSGDLFAGWHNGVSVGPAEVEVYLQFKSNQNIVPGTDKRVAIAPGSQPACAIKKVASFTVTRTLDGRSLQVALTAA